MQTGYQCVMHEFIRVHIWHDKLYRIYFSGILFDLVTLDILC